MSAATYIGNQIGEELGFGERGLLDEPGDEFRVRCEHGFIAGYLRRIPAHQTSLRAICEPVLDRQVAHDHDAHQMRVRVRRRRFDRSVPIAR